MAHTRDGTRMSIESPVSGFGKHLSAEAPGDNPITKHVMIAH